jgi:hypothetical protein
MVFAFGWHLLVYGTFDEWWAGYTYGPRYLTAMLPILTLWLAYGLVPYCRTPLVQAIVGLIVLYGVAVQAIGVYWDDDSWNRQPVPLEQQPQRVWDWGDWQVARLMRGAWRGADMGPLLATAFFDPHPARVGPLTPEDLANTVEVDAAPVRFEPGEVAEIAVQLRNDGDHTWPAFTGDIAVRYTVFLVVQWYRDGAPLPGVGDVLRLPRNVEPGGSVEVDVPLQAPMALGAYQIELRVTQAVDGTRGIADPDPLRISARVE